MPEHLLPLGLFLMLIGGKVLPNSALGNALPLELAQNSEQTACESSVLSRLQRHKIVPGETVASIAQQYNLLPETLIRLNPVLEADSMPVGEEILIPPFNGIRLEVPDGASWQDIANAYGIRPDVLFEINGCAKIPKVVFIPGVSWTPTENPRGNNYTGLRGYPLPALAKIGLGYGWHTDSTQQETFFHSGVDLLASSGTSVLAADGGIVVFAGQEGNYGNLVIVNHNDTRQTRYAHLATIQVKMGQSVGTGDILGTVGATGQPDLNVPHLHFEVRYQLPVGWVAQDPSIHLQERRSTNL